MVGYRQTNQKTDTGKTLTRWPVFVDHFRDRTQIDLLCNTLQALSDMGYIEIISSTDMDSAAKLTPRGLNLLQQQAPGVGDTVINILKGAAGETRTALIGAIIGRIFGGR